MVAVELTGATGVFLNMDPHQLLRKKILSFVLPENVSNEQRTGGLGGSLHQVPLTTRMKKALQTTEVFCSGPAHTNRLRMQRQNCFHAYSSSVSQACRRWQPSNTSRVTSGYSEHVKRGTKTMVWGSGAWACWPFLQAPVDPKQPCFLPSFVSEPQGRERSGACHMPKAHGRTSISSVSTCYRAPGARGISAHWGTMFLTLSSLGRKKPNTVF